MRRPGVECHRSPSCLADGESRRVALVGPRIEVHAAAGNPRLPVGLLEVIRGGITEVIQIIHDMWTIINVGSRAAGGVARRTGRTGVGMMRTARQDQGKDTS